MTANVEAFIRHHGVKGMRWGVRKERSSSRDSDIIEEPGMSRRKKIGLAVLGGAGALLVIGAGAAYMSKHGDTPMSEATPPKASEKLATAMTREPTGVIHASRGKHGGYGMFEKGGLDDALGEFERAFGTSGQGGDEGFHRYGDNDEKVAVVFKDPNGRKDRAGRPIRH